MYRTHATPSRRARTPRHTEDTGEAETLLTALRDDDTDSETAASLRARIAQMHRPVVVREAGRYRNRGVEVEELRQVASVGLMKAIAGFRPEHDKRFLSYLLPTMTGEIKRHFRDNLWAVHTPRPFRDRRGELHRFVVDFVQENAREPRQDEIGAHFDMDAKTTGAFLNATSSFSALSLDSPYGSDDEGDQEALGTTIGTVDRDLDLVVDKQALRKTVALLPERQRRVLSLRFVVEMTQSEIAEREGCSQMQISRLLSSSLARLREELLDDE